MLNRAVSIAPALGIAWFGFEERPSHTQAVWLWTSYFLSILPEFTSIPLKPGWGILFLATKGHLDIYKII